MKIVPAIIAVILLAVVGIVGILVLRFPSSADMEEAAPGPRMDTTTPEGAILCLEAAYRQHDLEKAISLKDFQTEARLMLETIDPGGQPAPELIKQTAHTLELAFRQELAKTGFPDFVGVESHFLKRTPIREGLVEVVEVTKDITGRRHQQILWASRGPNGWRVVIRP